MSKQNKTVIQRAAELLRADPELKHYQAMEQARRELSEVDTGTVPRVPKEKQ